MRDVIDDLAGIEPGSRLDGLRRSRDQARENAQASYQALFLPAEAGLVTLPERRAVAAFVAGLHRAEAEASHYARLLRDVAAAELANAVAAEAARGAMAGPVGRFPEGPLAGESVPAAPFRLGPDAGRLGERLSSALEHAHLLVFRPREADAEALGRLLEAGWPTGAVVTLSQIVAFLSFQIRVVEGLRVLAATPARAA